MLSSFPIAKSTGRSPRIFAEKRPVFSSQTVTSQSRPTAGGMIALELKKSEVIQLDFELGASRRETEATPRDSILFVIIT